MRYYGYDEFLIDIKTITAKAKELDVDGVVGILRGGATLAHFLCEGLECKNMYTLKASSYHGQSKEGRPTISQLPTLGAEKTVAIVDEIVDSGETMKYVLEDLRAMYPDKKFVSFAIFQKPSAIVKADVYLHEANEWIDFFWEADMREVENV